MVFADFDPDFHDSPYRFFFFEFLVGSGLFLIWFRFIFTTGHSVIVL